MYCEICGQQITDERHGAFAESDTKICYQCECDLDEVNLYDPQSVPTPIRLGRVK